MAKLVAVISGTISDLPEHRKIAIEACVSMDVLPNARELIPPSHEPILTGCQKAFEKADIYIGIVGYKYGYVPSGSEKSISEIEYEIATELNIPRLMFLMGESHLIKVKDVDTGDAWKKQENFRNKIMLEHIIGSFDSPLEFKGQLMQALSSLLKLKENEERQASIEKGWRQGSENGKVRNLLRVFVAAPQDVQEERQCMPRVIESLNKTLGRVSNVTVELWRWETDAPPSAGEPQVLIDPELDQADAVVVIFWNRFGTPSSDGTTGTESEVLSSLKKWKEVGSPQVMIYFCQRAANLGKEELKQKGKVLDFKDEVGSSALTIDYDDASDFERRVRDDLFLVLSKIKN